MSLVCSSIGRLTQNHGSLGGFLVFFFVVSRGGDKDGDSEVGCVTVLIVPS